MFPILMWHLCIGEMVKYSLIESFTLFCFVALQMEALVLYSSFIGIQVTRGFIVKLHAKLKKFIQIESYEMHLSYQLQLSMDWIRRIRMTD